MKNFLLIVFSSLLLTVLAVGSPMAATVEVSQLNPLTANSEYDRNPSIINDGTDYWLFYTKGDDTSTSGVRGSYNPDGDTYVVYYKTAGTIAGLAGASETKLALSESARPANFDQRVVSATYFNSKVYAFVSSGQSGTDRGLYYYEYNGTWSGPTTLIADATARGGHVNVTSDTSRVYIVWESSDASSDCYTWDGTTSTTVLSSKIDISTDNQPKITLMGSTLYVVSVEDGSGDIEVYSAAVGASPSFSSHSTAVTGAGLYDPCIFNDGTDLYVVTAPYVGGNDQQYLIQAKYDGSWATSRTVSNGGYGGTYWWEYWPCGYHDGTDAYVFFTTETSSPTFSDGEIAYVKMDWDLDNDHYFYIQPAIDEATDGDTINVADGTYTEQLSITGKGLTITGQSEAGVIVEAGASPTTGLNVFTINAATYDITIQDMTIRNGDYGIRSTAGNVDVLNCTLYHNGWDGTGMPAPPTAVGMAALWASGSTTNGGAIRIQDSASSEIADCTVYDNARGIRYQDGDNGDIHHNDSYNNLESGIYLASSSYDGSNGCTNTDVYNNTVLDNMNNGVLVIGGITNSVHDNDIYDNWNSGVMLWHVADTTIESNTIDNNCLYSFNGIGSDPADSYGGVCADGDVVDASVTFVFKLLNNTITDNQAGAAGQKIGVRLDDPLDTSGIEITGNTISGHDTDIHVKSQAATTTVNYNSFDGSTTGVQNDDTSATLDAENNWWNAPDGPGPVGPGSGVGVSTYVDYDPWGGNSPVEITSAVPQGLGPPFILYKGHPMAFDITYNIYGAASLPYDVVAVARPHFGKKCKKLRNGKLRHRIYKAKAASVGAGSHVITISEKPNNPGTYYTVPPCGKTYSPRKVVYKVKLKSGGSLVAKDVHKEIGQIEVR